MTEVIAAIVGAIVGAFFGRWVEHFATRKERQAKEAAESELKTIRRRGDAPFFTPSPETFDGLNIHGAGNEIRFWPAGSEDLLCFLRDEVDQKVAAGSDVGLVVDNFGQTARALRFELEGQQIEFSREANIEGAHGLYYLCYPYAPEKHGQTQMLKVSFETDDGVQDTHAYQMKHGLRGLKRVDPPLPGSGS